MRIPASYFGNLQASEGKKTKIRCPHCKKDIFLKAEVDPHHSKIDFCYIKINCYMNKTEIKD
jgi:DNA-directed RNA polymerase subunit RPC12/RpoP